TQPVSGAQGSTRKVEASAIISTSPAPWKSAMPTPPPAVKAGKTVRCDVSFSSSELGKPTPDLSAPWTSDTASVLPRNTPCWSANENRTCFRPRSVRRVLQQQRARKADPGLERSLDLRHGKRLAAQHAVLVGERKPDLLQTEIGATCPSAAASSESRPRT